MGTTGGVEGGVVGTTGGVKAGVVGTTGGVKTGTETLVEELVEVVVGVVGTGATDGVDIVVGVTGFGLWVC